jgi:hypothetical protein
LSFRVSAEKSVIILMGLTSYIITAFLLKLLMLFFCSVLWAV